MVKSIGDGTICYGLRLVTWRYSYCMDYRGTTSEGHAVRVHGTPSISAKKNVLILSHAGDAAVTTAVLRWIQIIAVPSVCAMREILL